MKITLIAPDNCALSTLTGPAEIFLAAGFLQAPDIENPIHFEVQMASITGKPITGFGNIGLTPHTSIRDIDQTDFILIPGFIPVTESQLAASEGLIEWLKHHHQMGVLIGSVCTGAFLLAETGLLDGKTATTNWQFADLFRKRYPRVHLEANRLLCEENGLISAGAATAYLDLCLYVIEKFASPELAANCSRAFLIDPNRNAQSPYMILNSRKTHHDPDILSAQKWMEDHYGEMITIEDVAKHTAISLRHFNRRFKNATGESPNTYLQRIRIESAKRQLETTRKTVDEITFAVGYENSNSFRVLFKRHTTLTPSLYRSKFSRIVAG